MPKILVLVGFLLVGVAYVAYDMTRQPTFVSLPPLLETPPYKKHPAPDIQFNDLNGQNIDIKDLHAKTVFLHFWATWCPPCIVEMPQLIELAQREDNDFVLIALSVDEGSDVVQSFFDKISPSSLPDNFIIGMDSDRAISKDLFDTTMYPETFIINPDGIVIEKVAGVVDWLSPRFKSLIDDQRKDQNNE